MIILDLDAATLNETPPAADDPRAGSVCNTVHTLFTREELFRG